MMRRFLFNHHFILTRQKYYTTHFYFANKLLIKQKSSSILYGTPCAFKESSLVVLYSIFNCYKKMYLVIFYFTMRRFLIKECDNCIILLI